MTRRHGRVGSRSGGCGDQGRVSVFAAIGLLLVVVFLGITVDTAGQVRAIGYAQSTAAEAARAAGQALDPAYTAATGQHRIDPTAARQAAIDYLDQAGIQRAQVHLSTDLTRITVTVWITYQPQVLSLIGVGPREIPARHTAALTPG